MVAFEVHIGGVFSVGYPLSYTLVGVQSWGGSKVVAFSYMLVENSYLGQYLWIGLFIYLL